MIASRRFVSAVVVTCYVLGLALTPLPARGDADSDNMDKLMGPIALYPDALLAQVLTAATSPDQVTEFNTWLGQQTAKGSDLQQAAMDAKFDAAFASLAIFPDVIKMMAENMDWTKEIGTAYLSSKDQVNASIQRLRAQAEAKGNLKSNEQQKVTVDNQGGSQTIVIEPSNPQVVYVPQYDPQVVYVQSAPPPSSNDAGMALLVGFGLGIAIGAAMNNSYYGWGAWGWHGGGVYYGGGPWRVPPYPRYPYARPVPAYRPRPNVYAPRNTNINVNVNNNRVNAGNHVNAGNNTNVGNRGGNNINSGNRNSNDRGGSSRPGSGGSGTRNTPSVTNSSTARGRPSGGSSVGGSNPSAFGGYGSGSSAHAASSRGRSSVGASHGGGGGRRR